MNLAPALTGRPPSIWRDPTARRFLLSQAAGQSADAITAMVVARVLLTGSDGGVDPDALLQTLAVATVPYAVVGPIAGIVADRWSRRRALGTIHLARSALTIATLVAITAGHRPSGLVLAAALLSAARLVYALRASALPWVAPPGRLVRIDAASLYVGMVAAIVGGTFGGLAAGRMSAAALVLAAGLQLVAAVGFGMLRRDLGGRSTRCEVSWLCVAQRVARLATSSPTRFVIAVTASNRALLGASFATFVLLASEEYALGPDGYLLALAVTGAGSFVGAALAPRSHDRIGSAGVVAAAFVVPALLLSLAGSIDRRLVLEVALCLSFCSFQILRVVSDATVQASIADDTRGRVFSTYDVSYNLSYFAGAAAAIAFGAAGRTDEWFRSIGIAYGVLIAAMWLARRSFHPHRSGEPAARPAVHHAPATVPTRRPT
jgi:hypothetical protein